MNMGRTKGIFYSLGTMMASAIQYSTLHPKRQLIREHSTPKMVLRIGLDSSYNLIEQVRFLAQELKDPMSGINWDQEALWLGFKQESKHFDWEDVELEDLFEEACECLLEDSF